MRILQSAKSFAYENCSIVSFYLIADSGNVYQVNDAGHCEELGAFPAHPLATSLVESRNLLVSLNSDLILSKSRVLDDGRLAQLSLVGVFIEQSLNTMSHPRNSLGQTGHEH